MTISVKETTTKWHHVAREFHYKSDSIGNTMISQKGVRSNKTKHQVNHRSSKAAGKQISVYEELLEKKKESSLHF